MASEAGRRRSFLSTPRRFVRGFVSAAAALAIVGAVGLVDGYLAYPLAALILATGAVAALIPVEERQHELRAGRPVEPASAPAPASLGALAPGAVPASAAPPAEPEPDDGPEAGALTGPAQVVRPFRLPVAVGAERVWVVGEFNGWSRSAHPMERVGDEFVADIALEPGRAYRYRYLLDGERWENDWYADRYVPNDFGGDDSVVEVAASTGRVEGSGPG